MIASLVVLLVQVRSAGQPVCPDMTADNLSIVWTGPHSGCSSLDPSKDCSVADQVMFNVAGSQYDFGCGAHEFTWDFGDSSPVVQGKSPVHLFPLFFGLELFTVRVTVRNSRGVLVLTTTIPISGGTPTTTSDPRIRKFFADASRVMRGQPVTLFWQSQNTYMVRIDPIGYEHSGGEGDHTFVPERSDTYTLTAHSTNTTAAKRLDVEVVDAPCPLPPPVVSIDWLGRTSGCTRTSGHACDPGETIQFSVQPFGDYVPVCFHQFEWSFGAGSTSTRQNPVQSFVTTDDFPVQLAVSNAAGRVTDTVPVRVALGITLFTAIEYFIATPATVVRGQPVTLRWSARDAPQLRIDPLNLRTNELTGSYVVTPTANTTYTMTASGTDEAVSVAVTVIDVPPRRRVVKP